MDNIAPAIAHLAVELDSLASHPLNARQGDIGAVSESLRLLGQYRPIVVQRSTGFVLAGNHTMAAARSLGWKHIAALLVDVDDAAATRILLADNKTADGAEYNLGELIEELEDLMNGGGLLGTGYTPDDLDDLIALAGAIKQTEIEEFHGGYSETADEREVRQGAASQGSPRTNLLLALSETQWMELVANTATLGVRYGKSPATTRLIVQIAVGHQAELLEGGE